jgi:hypothetical protein
MSYLNIYSEWVARFENYVGPYKVSIHNSDTQQSETYSCTLECAIAYLETMCTEYDFLPTQIKIKQGLWKRSVMNPKENYYSPMTKYAEISCDETNTEDGRYIVCYAIDGRNEVSVY